MDGVKGIFDSKKAILLVVVVAIYWAAYQFMPVAVADKFVEATMPLVLAYFVVETGSGIVATIKGSPRGVASDTKLTDADKGKE